MGLIKDLFYTGLGASLFLGGMFYEHCQEARNIRDLNAKIEYKDSIDYKVESLMLVDPKLYPEVDGALDKFYKKYLER